MTDSRAGRTTMGPGCLSAVFGMGTGVSTRVWSPAVSECLGGAFGRSVGEWLHRLFLVRVAVRGGGGAAKRSAVSTGPLSVSPRLHARPIDPVVCREPSCVDA